MVVAIMLALAAAATFAWGLPDYLTTVRAAVHSPGATSPAAPSAFVPGAFAGLAALVLVAMEQFRNKEYGWMAASFFIPYAGIIAYAARRLAAARAR